MESRQLIWIANFTRGIAGAACGVTGGRLVKET